MSLKKVHGQIKMDTFMWESRIHGTPHCGRLRENGLLIAAHSQPD